MFCGTCWHPNPIPAETPPFGTAMICSECRNSLISAGGPPEERYVSADLVRTLLGYRCALLHPSCPWCSKANYSLVVPAGSEDTYFSWNQKQENPAAAFVVHVNCPHCRKMFVIEGDALSMEPEKGDQAETGEMISGGRRPYSVLGAMVHRDPDAALRALAQGGNPVERDAHGNSPAHYAAAYGYLVVFERLVQCGAEVRCKNEQWDTPLSNALFYGQPEMAHQIWGHLRDQVLVNGGELAELVRELCAIGVEVIYPPSETVSGFWRRDQAGDWHAHPRVVEIGKILNEHGGMETMRRAASLVEDLLGRRAANNLSSCWNRIGNWMA